MVQGRNVVFFGGTGHGKTFLVNKICGTNHASSSGAQSCTLALQYGWSNKHGIFVIDTPGIGSSSSVAAQIAAQKVAVEDIPLSGIYVVVRYMHRVDELAHFVEPVMDFLGTEDIRIIVTHVDNVCVEWDEMYHLDELRVCLSSRLDIPADHITMVGRNTPGQDIEDFIQNTLHKPVTFEINDAQIASISSLAGVRQYNKPIQGVVAIIEAAAAGCKDVIANGACYETDLVIVATQAEATKMVTAEKEKIFKDAMLNISSTEVQNFLYGKAGAYLSLKLQEFIKMTNKLLTWDVTDTKDVRNQYRQCPNCDAVYVKEGGCDVMSCGGWKDGWKHVPQQEPTKSGHIRVIIEPAGGLFSIRFFFEGTKYTTSTIITALTILMKPHTKPKSSPNKMTSKFAHAKVAGTRELNIYCGRATAWIHMLPIRVELLRELGEVPLMPHGPEEKASQDLFNASLRFHEARNRSILKHALQSHT